MCGILSCVFSSNVTDSTIYNKYLRQLSSRGPDDIKDILLENTNLYMGFTRLSINDLSSDGMQPMRLRFVTFDKEYSLWLICNGEIFNHREICNEHGFVPKSKSDCEVILHLYWKLIHGDLTNASSPPHIENSRMQERIGELINLLDGEFAFVLYDELNNVTISARDNFGVRPLFWGVDDDLTILAFASELKALSSFCTKVKQFTPGSYHVQSLNGTPHIPECIEPVKYCSVLADVPPPTTYDEPEALRTINRLLRDAVQKRLMSDRPLCCLLSGGLDSSLVSALVASHYPPYTLNTFSIGLKGSPDLFYAQKVADFIKSNHHSIELSEEDFLSQLETTVKTIESYDTTSVRASVGNLLVAKYIKEHTDYKVVFNGDYSDEVCGGYKYMWNAPSPKEFDAECRSLVENICFFDSLRSDRTISSQGLEARVPFADKKFVRYYLNLPAEARMPKDKDRPEKYLLRKAFEHDAILPPDIIWRPKEAFSDGVSKNERSWHNILNNHVNDIVDDETFNDEVGAMVQNTPMLKETFYYRKMFEKEYGKQHVNIIPGYWLPKWCGELNDPSAREINGLK